MASFKKSFLKNLFVSGGFTYLTQLIIFVASFVTSRLLSPEEFGLIGLITIFSGFITIFSDSGISMAVIRSPYKERYYRGLHFVSIIIGIMLTIITLIIIYPISLFYNNSKILFPGIAIAFLFIIKSFSIVPNAILQKELRFAASGSILFISTVTGTIATIVLAFLGFSYWSLIWSQYFTAIVSLIILYNKSPGLFVMPGMNVIKKSFLLARTLIGSLTGFNMINYWARNSDNLIVGKSYGTNDLGVYNRAYMMLQLPLNLITGIFSSVLLPSFVKHKNSGADIEKEYYFILKIISLLNLPVAMVLILFPNQFVLLLWGEKWKEVSKMLPYFGLLVMTQTLVSSLGNILIIEKKEKALMYSGWINSILIVIAIVIGSFISLISIASCYSLVYIAIVLPFTIFYLIKRKLNFTSNILRFWLPKVLLSGLIWFFINTGLSNFLFPACSLWIIMIFWDVRSELVKLSSIIKKVQ